MTTTTDGTCLGCLDIDHGTDTLARDLHEAELGEREDVVLGTIVGHKLLHVTIELLAMFLLGKVDEIDDDDATHVAQTHLTGYLVSSSEVDKECIGLLILGLTAAVARIDVDDMQGLGVLDDDIGTGLA